MQYPFITAHSGCEGTDRDSLISIDRAIEAKADGIEVDVRVAPDGQLRMSHDKRDALGYLDRPLIYDALSKIKDTNLYVNMDIKEPWALLPAIAMGESLGIPRERLIISGCTSPEMLARDPSIASRVRVFLNIEEVFKHLYLAARPAEFGASFAELMNDTWKPLRASGIPAEWIPIAAKAVHDLHAETINLPRELLTQESAAIFREANCPVSVWTIRQPEDLDGVYEHRPYNITTIIPTHVRGFAEQHPFNA